MATTPSAWLSSCSPWTRCYILSSDSISSGFCPRDTVYISISMYLSIYLYICIYLYLYIFTLALDEVLYLVLDLYLERSTRPKVCIYPSTTSVYLYLYLYLSIYLSIFIYIYLYLYLHARLGRATLPCSRPLP